MNGVTNVILLISTGKDPRENGKEKNKDWIIR